MGSPAVQVELMFSLRPHVVATVIDDGAVLLDLETKFFFRLNSSAWAITQLFETAGVTRAEVEARCRTWGASESELKSVDALIETMEHEKLLESSLEHNDEPVEFSGRWVIPTIERQAEPLHRLITSAFDPSIPLAE